MALLSQVKKMVTTLGRSATVFNREEWLDGILPRPLLGRVLVSLPLSLVNMCDFRDKRVVGVRVGKHGTDGQENFRDCKSRAPLVP